MQKEKTVKIIEAINNSDLSSKNYRRLRVCAYCRVSSEHFEQKLSFDAQKEHFESYISNNPNWDYSGIYADYGISGKSKANRTEFNRMVEDAKKHRFDLIITKSISRFARNTADCIETVRELKLLGVGVFFEKENISTLSAESELVLTILSSIAEEELLSLSQNIRWSNQKRLQQGKVQIVTERFMGYDKDKNGDLIINEEQAKIVTYIFDLHISGLGVGTIAKKLMEEGIKNVSGNVMWSHSVLLGMLRNEKYCGDALLQKTITADTITFKRKKNRGEAPMAYIKNNHEAIIDREKFEHVQLLLKQRASSKGYNPDNAWKYNIRYPFSSKIFCGNCGEVFKHTIRNSTTNPTNHWSCSTYVDSRKSTCDMKPIKNTTVEKLFVRLFNKLYTNKNILKTYILTLESMGQARAFHKRVTDIDRNIEELLQEERALFMANEKGYLQSDALIVTHSELVANIERLRKEKQNIISDLDGQDKRLTLSKDILSILEKREIPMEAFEEDMFSFMITKIIVKQRDQLVYHLKNGLELQENYTIARGEDII